MKSFYGLLLCLVALPSFGATCKVSEYSTMVNDDNNRPVPAAQEPAVATQNVTYTTSTASAAFNAKTRFVRIICDAKAHFKFSTDGTNATAAMPYLPTDAAEYFSVPRGVGYLVEFYDGSS
jgi:hypothetical protein